MKLHTKRRICLSLMVGLALLVMAGDSGATVKLFNDKLTLNGYVKEVVFLRTTMQDREKEFHDNDFDYIKTSAGIEALFSIKESNECTVRFFTGLKWWYEAAPKFDDQMRRSMPHRWRKDYISPQSFDDDMLNEAYLDLISGPFQIRVGKQIVVWGNLDVDRAADVVNAVDFRHSMFGIDKWEEFKRGAWMIRMFYQSSLPGDLRFEAIFNPGDFRENLIPMAFCHYGTSPHFNAAFDAFAGSKLDTTFIHYLSEQMSRDAPGWNRKNYEFGFKVSGYTLGVDWSLIYYNSINKNALVDPTKELAWTLAYIGYAAGGPAPDWHAVDKLFKFKRNQIVGGTFEKYISAGKLTRGSILTIEWYYDIGSPFNTTEGRSTTGISRKDIFGFGVKWYQKFNIPGFTQSRIATGKQFEMTITYYGEHIFCHKHDLKTDTRYHRPGDAYAENISIFCIQPMFNYSWTFVFNCYYRTKIDKWFFMPALRYNFPGKHWSTEVGYACYGGAKNTYTHSIYDKKDSVIFKLSYEW